MATHASAEKAARQAVRRREKNSQVLSRLRTEVKKFRLALGAKVKDKAESEKQLVPMFNEIQRTLMKAANKNIVKTNTASRNVSRLNAALHKVLNG